MSPARVQLFFFVGICLITLYFSVLSGIDLFRYLSLGSSSSARISNWEIIALGDKYGLKAKYWFEFKDKNWRGSYTLAPPYFLNEEAALSALKEKAKEPWRVWYHPNDPHDSVLEKIFPCGILFRTTVCFAVLIYFLSIKRKFLPVSAFRDRPQTMCHRFSRLFWPIFDPTSRGRYRQKYIAPENWIRKSAQKNPKSD